MGKGVNTRKPTTARGRRLVKAKGPRLVEQDKKLVVLRGSQTGQETEQLLQDVHSLTKTFSVNFRRKETVRPFEDHARIEKLFQLSNTQMFLLGSKTKKHPCRLTIGRSFDGILLDMAELEVSNILPMTAFTQGAATPITLGSKPLLVFQGPAWENSPALARLRSLLLDVFKGASPKDVALEAVQHAIVFTAVEKTSESVLCNFRCYRLNLKKTGTKLPFGDLDEMGPRFDFALARERIPDFTLWKAATAKAKAENQSKIPVAEGEKPKKKIANKNITTDALGQKVGRIHLGRQDLSRLYTPHHNKRKPAKAEDAAPAPKKARGQASLDL